MIGKTNSQGVVPKGTINITENGTYSIASYSEAVVSVPGLVPSGTLEISSNGVYDVTSYAGASVNVQGGGGSEAYEWIDVVLGGTSDIYSGYCPSIIRSRAMQEFVSLTAFVPTFSSNWSHIVVGQNAFNNDQQLATVNFLSSSCTKTISYGAFSNCMRLSGDVLNINSIQDYAFYGCKSLGMVTFVGSSVNILMSAFAGTNNNNRASASAFTFSCDILFMANGVFAFNDCSIYNFDGVGQLSLGDMAFASCSIQSFIHSSVYASANWQGSFYLRYGTFMSCSSLSIVSMSAYNNQGSTNLYLAFGTNCFTNCSNLEEINIQPKNFSSWTYISVGQSAFYGCLTLKSFPFELLSSCYSGAFAYAGIYSIRNSTKGVWASSTFQGCSRLRFVEIATKIYFYPSVFMNCSALSFARFIDGPWTGQNDTLIGNSIFKNCISLKSMLFSDHVTFYSLAFQGCTQLESIYLLGSSLASDYYGNFLSDTPIINSTYLGYYGSIYVPESLYSSYIAATNWVAYSERFVSVTDAEKEQLITDYYNVSYIEE